MKKKYRHLVVAGTFDHLHFGHQQFLTEAISQAETAWCGVAARWSKNQKLLPESIQTYRNRTSQLIQFLKAKKWLGKTRLFRLQNPYQPAISSQVIDSIAVTQDSLKGALLINQLRTISNLSALKILKCPLIKADDAKRLSSSRIRLGEVNRQGLVYQQLLTTRKNLYLPHFFRSHFQSPIGKLLSKLDYHTDLKKLKSRPPRKKPLVIGVGDITCNTLSTYKITTQLAIFDHRCQRQTIRLNLHQKLISQASLIASVVNQPSTLTGQTLSVLPTILSKIIHQGEKAVLKVKGEEDLLVLPLILLTPLKTLIYYGQPQAGLVKIEVTEKIKAKALNLLQKFRS